MSKISHVVKPRLKRRERNKVALRWVTHTGTGMISTELTKAFMEIHFLTVEGEKSPGSLSP